MVDADVERLLWCLLPDFDIQFAREPFRLSSRGHMRMLVPETFARFRPSTLRSARGGLIVSRAVTEERVIHPVAGKANVVPLSAIRSWPGRTMNDSAVRKVKGWIDEILRTHERPEWRRPWREAVNATGYYLDQYARLDLSPYRFVLAARQSHPLVRALILAADGQDVPVVFLPHSPMTRWQVDLPFSYAGMRGEAERTLVAEATNADHSRIAVVGNPDTAVLEAPMPVLRADAPGVLALSPDPEPVLRSMVVLLRDAGLSRVVVAPHPRSDLKTLRRIIPASWQVFPGTRTTDLLQQGPPWVIQRSSGIAWEAAAFGIPTADIRSAAGAPDYPFLADESVYPALRSSEDVRRFVASAPIADRLRIRAHATSWVTVDGSDAVRRARALIDAIDGPRSRINDEWAPGGTLRSASVLGV